MVDNGATPAKSLLDALADSAPDAIITIDAGSTILSANQAVQRIFGYEPSELIGQSLTVLMPERLRDQHDRGIARYMDSGIKRIPWTGTRLTGLRRDGAEVPIEISFGEFVDTGGRRVFSGFIRDMSEHLRQRRALDSALEDAQLQSQLLAAVGHAVISTDVSGIVLTWNDHAAELYGWPSAEAVGRNLTDLVDPLREFDRPQSLDRLRAGHKVSYERQARRRDGKMIWVSVVAAAIRDDSGRVTRLVGTSVDITERHTLETRMLQAQRLDALGRLASGVAHDFNNLLTVIRANAELVSGELDTDSMAARDTAEIIRAADRGAALSKQLLTFSRRDQSSLRPVDLRAIVLDLELMLRRLIGADVVIRLLFAADTPAVMGDVGKLEQVLTNLVINARDAMPAGGVISIGTERHETLEARVTAEGQIAPGTFAKICVADTGHGMSESVRARIFEPFFTTKAQDRGSGLGLATVYGIVVQSGGFIDVESELGKGSQFCIYLPAVSDPQLRK